MIIEIDKTMIRKLFLIILLFMPVLLSAQESDDAQFGDVVINEVMADPNGLVMLPQTEYVEIYNASGRSISLNGWTFYYYNIETALPDVTLPAGGYAVLYRAGHEISVASGALSLGIDRFPSALANDGRTVGLKNSIGEVIDEYTYPKAKPGKSYERAGDGSWHESTDEKGGTPGAVNSPSSPGNGTNPDPDPDPGADPGTDPDPGADPDPDPPVSPTDTSQPGDVVINEVMADPNGLVMLPQTEYVEIYNASGREISLNGWIFVYYNTETALPDVILPAGSYAVLYRAGREISVASGALSLGIDRFPSALANDGRTVGLKNSIGLLIDVYDYPKAKPGKSFERADDGSWHESTDEKGGTPGAVNSPSSPGNGTNPDPDPDPDPPVSPTDTSQPGDVVINEVMADPNGLIMLPQTEYVEIYNASGREISLKGWTFVYYNTETALPDVILPAGGYAVLYRAGSEISVASGALSLGIDRFPAALANDGRTVGLKNSRGELIDAYDYPKAKPGKSYERADDGTWYVSTDEKGGTPGAVNSPSSPGNDTNPDPDTDPDLDPAPDPDLDPGADPDPDPDLDPDIDLDLDPPPTDTSQPGDVVINEVMADPNGLIMLPQTEYIEIFNATEDDISLNGWIFVYMATETVLPDVVLPAGGFAVLYRAGRDIIVAMGALSLGMDRFPSALANDGRIVGLKNSKGELIDEFDYPKAKPGKSYERADDGTWHDSTDEKGGTPGTVNSTPPASDVPADDKSQPGDVLINEVMANPVGLTVLPETEYIEIFNASEEDISLNGWVFVYDGKETKLPNTIIPSGGYAVLYRYGREIYVAPGALSLGISNFPAAIANTSKTIGIKNSKGVFIDEMTYPNASAGKSYERAVDDTWHISTDEKGGTPGAVNSLPLSSPPLSNDTSQPGDVLINEVMANPSGLTMLPQTEYVEIYNASEEDVSLNGWVFIYDGKDTKLPNTILPAGGYAVLYRDGRDISVAPGALSLGITTFPSALANTSKTLGLKNANGVIIDEMIYPNAKAGMSYERAYDDSWHLSTNEKGGTPGAANSPPPPPPPPDNNSNPGSNNGGSTTPINDTSQPGDVVINEVMANPNGLTALPTTEYVEIYNTSQRSISLNGWAFIYDGKDTKLPNVSLPAKGYAVLYRSGREITVTKGSWSLGISNFPSALANTGKNIGLKNSKGVIINEMTYPAAIAGKSYERDSNESWHVSTDVKGGTPGAVNSPPPSSDSDSGPSITDNSKSGDVIINEVMANPNGLTALPETEYVEIYNASEVDVSLSSWTFIYDGREVKLPNVLLVTGNYAVLYRTGRDITVADGALTLGIDNFPTALANTGKTLGLKNSKDELIDEMTYPAAKAGKSYERATDGSWHLSTDEKGGTPGAENSSPLSSGTDTDPDPDDPPNPDPTLQVDNSVPGDILINEVMANPNGLTALPETEYVELFNVSGSDISLYGWVFIYDGRDTQLPNVSLSAGGYAVLYRAGREIFVADDALSLGISDFPSAIANTTKTLGLKNSKGELIDEMTYPNASAGKSYERADDGAWHVSTDEKGGTPGAANSPPPTQGTIPGTSPDLNDWEIAEPYEIVINEILPDPFAGGSEYIELYNRSNRSLSLSNLVIAVRRTDGSLNTHYPLNTIEETISPDGYIVLTKEYAGVADFYFMPSTETLHELRLPTLNNEGASIVLFRHSDEVIIDEVTYSTKWHSSSIKNKKGVSLERIDPNKDSQDETNWISATIDVGYGTPGYQNSQYKNHDLADKTIINAPEYVPGFDYYTLTYQTAKPGFRCRAEIYATNGRKVAEICNNQLISLDGELRWDGKGLDSNRLTPGVYVFYAEIYHPDGNLKQFKKAFLVR